MWTFQTSEHTDIGDRKPSNQDSVFHKTEEVNGCAVGMFVLADGCGGMAFGREISQLIVTCFDRFWREKLLPLVAEKGKIPAKELLTLLETEIQEINSAAKRFGETVSAAVGSTLSVLVILDDVFAIKNVGDSRIYRFRGNRLKQLTQDQSLVAEMIRKKQLTRRQAKTFPRKNVLTMCIGAFDPVITTAAYGKVRSKDRFLLCCDGLYNALSHKEIAAVFRTMPVPFPELCAELRARIPAGLAKDNVSSVICRCERKSGIWSGLFGR